MIRAVVVDDDKETVSLFSEILSSNNIEVVGKGYNGQEAAFLYQKLKPDVIFLDVMMPDVSGLEVLRFMRREPKLKGTPVIVVSARSMPSDIREGVRRLARAIDGLAVDGRPLRPAHPAFADVAGSGRLLDLLAAELATTEMIA